MTQTWLMPAHVSDALLPSLDTLKGCLNLTQHTICFNTLVTDDENALAYVSPHRARHRCNLTLTPGWFEKPYTQRTEILCHELLHMPWSEHDEELELLIKPYIPPTLLDQITKLIRNREEYIVDDLSLAVAAMLPKALVRSLNQAYKLMDSWWKTVDR